MRPVAGNGAYIAGGAPKSADEEEILMPADQRRNGFASLKYERRRRDG
jgi:hypothetical protein